MALRTDKERFFDKVSLPDENVYRWGNNLYCRVCRLIRERSKFGVHPDKYRKEVPFS